MPLPIFSAIDRREIAHAVLLGFCGEDENSPPPWTSGTLARDADGDPIDPLSWNAVAWSLAGMNRRMVAEHAEARSITLTDDERAEAEREILAAFTHYGLRRGLPLRPEGYEQAIAAFNDTPGVSFDDIAVTVGRTYWAMLEADTTTDLRTLAGRARPDA